MKVILDLNKSFNNYHWTDKKELEDYIIEIKSVLWYLYDKDIREKYADTEEKTRFYDLLDMFEKFEVKECD